MKNIPFVIFHIFVSVSLCCLSFGEEAALDFNALDKVVSTELKQTKTPGAVVAVVKGEKVIYCKGFGKSTIDPEASITPDSIFRAASVGKMLTATVLTKLAEEGKLKFDEPIGTYVKELSPKVSKLTIHQLLSHTAGLRDVERFSGYTMDEDGVQKTVRYSVDSDDLRKDILAWKDDIFFQKPNTIFSYSNIGYSIAGLVVEEITGQKFHVAMDDLLFKPAGMNHTTFPAILSKTPSSPNSKSVFMGFTDYAVHRPVGTYITTIKDLTRFAIMMLNQGKIDGKQVLSPSIFSTISMPRSPVYSGKSETAQYGYGLESDEYRGVKILQHGGSLPGYGCRFVAVPDHKLAIITMCNNTGKGLGQTIEKAMEMMVPLTAKVEQKELQVTEEELKPFVGTYVSSYYPRDLEKKKIEVSIKDGKLFIVNEDKSCTLEKIGLRRFISSQKSAIPSGVFVFIPGSDGSIEYLHRRRVWTKVSAK
jgi:CubicO group peptidase (beta-lactamase class C family)